MTDKKLTDNEIKKIKKRLKDIVEENELEYFHSNTMGWYPEIRLAYMAIKHLQAENEQYKANSDSRQTNEYKNIDIAHIKAEAYKEFAERLKEKGFIILHHKMILSSDIDNLLKELVNNNEKS